MSSSGRASAQRGKPSVHDTGTSGGQDALALHLAALARDLQERPSPQAVMDEVVDAVARAVPGAQECSISLVRSRRHVESPAATGELARRFDLLQEETGQGPCLDALFDHLTVRVDELATDPRWPLLAARAPEVGAASAVCFQLFVQGGDLGALNVLSREPHAFTDASEHVGLLLAAHAAVALADALRLEGVTSALAHRDVIGQAKGILMERFKVTAEQAFTLLARASQDSQRKLHEVAGDLARTGRLGG